MASGRSTKSIGPPRVDIISIGTLSRNRLWGESEAVRTAHATTSLIRVGGKSILIDPGLPPAAIGARLFERTGLVPEQIDTIFLTNFRSAHRAGLALFEKSKVLIDARLKATIGRNLFDVGMFYRVINATINNVYTEALKVITTPAKFDILLPQANDSKGKGKNEKPKKKIKITSE